MQPPGKYRSLWLWGGSALFLLFAITGWIVGERWPEGVLPGGGPLQAATCGDSVIDPSAESCDDGKAVSGDGCSSTCQIECSVNSDCPANQPVSPCYNTGVTPWSRNLLSGLCISNACEWEALSCNTEAGLCTDGVNNDGDEFTDCADSECSSHPSCRFPCDNDGTADTGETCSNCPYDVRCTATQKCIAGSCTASTGCEREDVCGDGWVSGFEKCDDGGICKGSLNLSYVDEHCFDIDPTGNPLAGVARCRATGGRCVAQGGDGCDADCQDECHPTDSPCLIDADCCTGESCVNGRCGTACGNSIADAGEMCGEPSLSCQWPAEQTCTNCQCSNPLPCCQTPQPHTFNVTLSNVTDCSALDGLTFTAPWDATLNEYGAPSGGWKGVKMYTVGLDNWTMILELYNRCLDTPSIPAESWSVIVKCKKGAWESENQYVPSLTCASMTLNATADVAQDCGCSSASGNFGIQWD